MKVDIIVINGMNHNIGILKKNLSFFIVFKKNLC
ncbi:MAG: hypothetical protein K0R06_671 [Clostridium sp.]|jgi:hypothetical protein|nr:hypothetical protein [Clostridium sp.]